MIEWTQALGETLPILTRIMIHTLWIGTAIGLAAVASRLILHRAAPTARYAAGLFWMAALTATPLMIGWMNVDRSAALFENPPAASPIVDRSSARSTFAASSADRPVRPGVVRFAAVERRDSFERLRRALDRSSAETESDSAGRVARRNAAHARLESARPRGRGSIASGRAANNPTVAADAE